jgi:hypothetical protein
MKKNIVNLSKIQIFLVDEKNYQGTYGFKLSNQEEPRGLISLYKNDLFLYKVAKGIYYILHDAIQDMDTFIKHNRIIHLSPSMITELIEYIEDHINKPDVSPVIRSELCRYRSRLESIYQLWIATDMKAHFYYQESYA